MARDKFHQEVRDALEKEGWDITADPLYIKVGRFPIQIDLGAEKLIGAEKNGAKIAVEVKTFGRISFITAFYEAAGKYITYREALLENGSERVLYLAMPKDAYDEYCSEALIKRVFKQYDFKILVYQPKNAKMDSWITN
jgi:glucose-6-phosphate 1-dehydrogenase